MGNNRKLTRPYVTRPKKRGAAQRSKQRAQRRRLVELGVSAEEAENMDQPKVRELLRHPVKTKAAYAKQA